MADTVTFQTAVTATPPDATIVATDDAGASGHVQIVKLALAADGSAVAIPADARGLMVKKQASTAAVTSVNDSAANQTLLASNADRLGASIYNDSTVILYVKLGTTASATSFSAKLFPEGYYEVPGTYTGQIDGVWASDAAGAARITELT